MGKTTAEEIDVEKVKATRCTFNSTQILWHSILYPLYVVYICAFKITHTQTHLHMPCPIAFANGTMTSSEYVGAFEIYDSQTMCKV